VFETVFFYNFSVHKNIWGALSPNAPSGYRPGLISMELNKS